MIFISLTLFNPDWMVESWYYIIFNSDSKSKMWVLKNVNNKYCILRLHLELGVQTVWGVPPNACYLFHHQIIAQLRKWAPLFDACNLPRDFDHPTVPAAPSASPLLPPLSLSLSLSFSLNISLQLITNPSDRCTATVSCDAALINAGETKNCNSGIVFRWPSRAMISFFDRGTT